MRKFVIVMLFKLKGLICNNISQICIWETLSYTIVFIINQTLDVK
jgi:hypothetical protein